jgi:hypothetical protein
VPTQVQEAGDFYAALTPAEQLRFLVDIGMDLTMAARDCYEVGTDLLTDPVRMRQLNEIQHRVLGHARRLIGGSRDRYPDDVLVRILLESGNAATQSTVAGAYKRVVANFSRDS